MAARDLASVVTTKWCLAMDELIEQDTERPSVDRMVIGLLVDHLRRHVLESATVGLSFTLVEVSLSVTFLHILDGPAEVA